MNKLLYQRITEFQDKTFPKGNPRSCLSHLKDEIEEIDYDLIQHPEDKVRVHDEYADAFILLIASAYRYGMTFDDCVLAISRKMDTNDKRKWGEPDERGVVKHIKE